ncbi:hypothetical protein [Plasticicumulans sp.]|uniref:hypothetical protein n=1 Tax=Plasticicumulans sp. TaxID=2307179 RepID=UPI003944CEB1
MYRDRINRRGEFYATSKLGLYGTELSAVAHFFREPWRTPVAAPALSDSDRAWLLAEAAFDLRALGRLTEAVEPGGGGDARCAAGLEARCHRRQQPQRTAADARRAEGGDRGG